MDKFQTLPGTIALYGTVDGIFAFLVVESTFLSGILPAGLELAPQSYCPAGFHPLLLMFNKVELEANDKLEAIFEKLSGHTFELNYHEFITMVPYVQFKDERYRQKGPYCYLPKLYLDNIWAVLGGRIFWEFNKEMAAFKVGEGAFDIATEVLRSTIFTSTFAEKAAPIPCAEVPNFERITPILQLPVVEYGVYGYVSSVYKVAYQGCTITPCSLQLHNERCDSMPQGELHAPSILDAALGCFGMRYQWSLTWAEFIAL